MENFSRNTIKLRMLFLRYFIVASFVVSVEGFCIAQSSGQNGGNAADITAADDSSRITQGPTKSPTGAMLRSLAIPGWGQWYNQQRIKAALVLVAQGTLIGFNRYYNNLASEQEPGSSAEAFYIDRRNLTYWLMGGVLLLSMIDAYIDAQLFDFDTGPDLAMRIGTIDTRRDAGKAFGLGISFRAHF